MNQNWEVGLDETLWSKDKNVELKQGGMRLTGDRELNSLKTVHNIGNTHQVFEFLKHRLTIGSGGIVIGDGRPHIFRGAH